MSLLSFFFTLYLLIGLCLFYLSVSLHPNIEELKVRINQQGGSKEYYICFAAVAWPYILFQTYFKGGA